MLLSERFRMIMKKIISLNCLILATLLFINPQAHAQEPLQNYQTHLTQAHHFFSKSHFKKALNAYEKSYAIEPLDSTLYNIAVSHFKLKNWQLTLDNFEELKRYQGSTDLVEYNIAVAYKKLGQQQKALSAFNELHLSANNEKIAQLAKQQIARLSNKTSNLNAHTHNNDKELINAYNKEGAQWQNMLSVQLGKDNNIVLPDDDANLNEGDAYLDLSFNSSWMSSSNLANAWMVDFTYFKSTYSEENDYDIDLYALAGRKYFTPSLSSQTRFWLGLSYDNIKLAGNNYINNMTYTLGGEYKFNSQQKLSIELSRKNISEGEAQYNYLAGNTNRIKVTWRNRVNNGYWRAGIKHYIDDRNDRITEDTNGRQTFNSLTSYSADRTTLFVNRSWTLGDWELGTDFQYRYSAFNDENTVITYDNDDLPAGTFSLGKREDNRFNVLLEISYNITDDLSVGGELDLSKNTSNIESYDYNQSSFSVGVNWMF